MKSPITDASRMTAIRKLSPFFYRLPDWKSKLSIRMVVGFAEKKDFERRVPGEGGPGHRTRTRRDDSRIGGLASRRVPWANAFWSGDHAVRAVQLLLELERGGPVIHNQFGNGLVLSMHDLLL
jgi:hypothetical protein